MLCIDLDFVCLIWQFLLNGTVTDNTPHTLNYIMTRQLGEEIGTAAIGTEILMTEPSLSLFLSLMSVGEREVVSVSPPRQKREIGASWCRV